MDNKLSAKELNDLIRLAKKALWADSDVRKQLQDNRVNIIPANFYSNIPLIDDVSHSFEYRDKNAEIYNAGIFDKNVLEEFLNELIEYAHEFNPPLEGCLQNPIGYFWKNPAFSYSDALAYYCVIRHFKPKRILEIGSGFSTLIADEALKKNTKGSVTIIEPYPKDFLKKLDTVDLIIESFVQDIPQRELIDLVETADIWFIDSTHTVKTGSDCLYIYLIIMPAIKKNMIVHTHDVFLPFGFPKKQILDKHIYWTEQYLLYAYMLDNPKIEVLFGSAYANSRLPDLLNQFMGGKYPGRGGSIWYRVCGE